jgi:hypothetical protein
MPRYKINEDTKHKHHILLSESVEECCAVTILLQKHNTDCSRYLLKGICWVGDFIPPAAAIQIVCNENQIPCDAASLNVWQYEYGGGNFIDIPNTEYTVYYGRPVRKKNRCRCGKEEWENGQWNHSFLIGTQFANYYCEYCFFETFGIIVPSEFYAEPNTHWLKRSDEEEENRKRQEAIASAIEKAFKQC